MIFAAEPPLERDDFESVCTRQLDGTVDMEPANLTRMCTLLMENAKLPYPEEELEAGGEASYVGPRT